MIERQTSSKNDKLDFFTMFYSRIIETLVKPLFGNVSEGKVLRGFYLNVPKTHYTLSLDDYFKANQMALILELTSFCVENHVQSMRNFIVQKDLLSTIAVYLRSQHHFMSLCEFYSLPQKDKAYPISAALRVLRKVIQQKDEQYNRYIIEKKVIDPIVDCFMDNGARYNLLNSAILEFFDFIRHVS